MALGDAELTATFFRRDARPGVLAACCYCLNYTGYVAKTEFGTGGGRDAAILVTRLHANQYGGLCHVNITQRVSLAPNPPTVSRLALSASRGLEYSPNGSCE